MSASTRRREGLPSAAESRRFERRLAQTVAVLYLLAGTAWVLVTDVVLYDLVHDPVLIARIETAKGWSFVALGGLFLYAVALRSAKRLTRAHAVTSAVVESIADGVLLLGRDRTIRYANPAAARMLRDRPQELVGMGADAFSRRYRLSYPDGSLVPPDRFVSQRVFDEGGPLHSKSVLHPAGAPEVVISTTAAAVRENVGEPAQVVVSVMHDITQSERFEQMRDQFFAAAAHSLKTPIAVIKANAQVVSRGAPTHFRRSIAAIERQCGRIDRLVQNLLVLARVRSRTLQLHPTELELGPLVERISREMAPASHGHGVHTELADSPRVHADAERLAMVLQNLLDEVFRNSRPGSPVAVLLRRRGGDAEVGLRYQPLPPEERTYEAYGEYDDIAIGRCVATTIVEAHGGTLGEETEGPETRTWFRVPVSEGANEQGRARRR